jgi:hypothetical protein
MMELLLAMNERMDANTKAMNEMKYETKEGRKIDREEMKQEIRASHEKIQENLKRTMEEIMNTNQAKTDVKLEELSEAMEKTCGTRGANLSGQDSLPRDDGLPRRDGGSYRED